MYEAFAEHRFNSILPKHTTQAAQSIRKARSDFARIPRLNKEVSVPGFLPKVPQPDRRIKPQAQSCCSLGAFAFPRLRFLAAYKLFGVLESILDAPAARKTVYYFRSSKTQIGGKEKVVFLFACPVSTDYQEHWFLRYPVPYSFSGIHKPFSFLASFAGFDKLEVANSFGHLFGGREFLAFLARSASCLFSFLAQQIVNICVPTHTRDYMSVGYILSCQRGVKTVSTAQKTPLRQPEDNLRKHLAGQFCKSRSVLSVQSHIDWQPQRLAAPGRIYSQCKHYQVQTPGVDHICTGRTNRVSPPACAVDFSATAMKQGAVQIGRYYTGWVKYSDQQNRQEPPQLAHCPGSIREKPMIRIVSFLSSRVCEWQDASDGMSCGAENPSGYEIEENFCRGNREYREKVLNYCIPCRSNNCIHANLPVLSLFPIKTSEGWYVCIDKSSKPAA